MTKKILSILLVLSLSGCAYVEPLVEGFNIISPSQETGIGVQMQSQIAKDMKVITGTADAQRVSAIGNRLTAALPNRDYNYQFFLVEDPTPNAFTIPGGSIYVHTGLLKFAAGDDEVAGVIAHEIGHAYDHHPAKGLSRQFGADFLAKLLFKENQTQFKKMTWQLVQQSVLLRYGRDEEFKADEIGYGLLKRSGTPTGGLIRFFKRLEASSQGSAPFSFLSTHPPTPERIARLEALERGGNTYFQASLS